MRMTNSAAATRWLVAAHSVHRRIVAYRSKPPPSPALRPRTATIEFLGSGCTTRRVTTTPCGADDDHPGDDGPCNKRGAHPGGPGGVSCGARGALLPNEAPRRGTQCRAPGANTACVLSNVCRARRGGYSRGRAWAVRSARLGAAGRGGARSGLSRDRRGILAPRRQLHWQP